MRKYALLLAVVVLFASMACAAQAPLTPAEKTISIATVQANVVRYQATVDNYNLTLAALSPYATNPLIAAQITKLTYWRDSYQTRVDRLRYILAVRGA